MTGLPWFKCFPQDLLNGMAGMPADERGIYISVLCLIYREGGPIRDEPRELAYNTGCTVRQWVKYRAALILHGKLYEVNLNGRPCLMNERCAEEIAAQIARTESLSERGSRGGKKRASVVSGLSNENNEGGQAIASIGLSPAQAIKTTDLEVEEVSEANASSSTKADKAEYPIEFETAWKAYPHVKGRSSKTKAFGYWRRISPARRDLLPAAISRYAKEGREPNEDCGAAAMERWLRDSRYLDWLEADRPPESLWTGPADVREAVVAARGEDFARAYLDPCAWQDVPERGVIPRTAYAVGKLKSEAAGVLRSCGVQIHERAA